MKSVIAYLRFVFCPWKFAKFVKRIQSEAYQLGWESGFDIGHRRGWMQLRGKIQYGGHKYVYQEPTQRN